LIDFSKRKLAHLLSNEENSSPPSSSTNSTTSDEYLNTDSQKDERIIAEVNEQEEQEEQEEQYEVIDLNDKSSWSKDILWCTYKIILKILKYNNI
jgi:hypothetical protein